MDEHQRKIEVLKVRHDTLKHTTTLSVAVPVALLAIYRAGILGPSFLIAIPLVMFGVAAVASLAGIAWIVAEIELLADAQSPRESPPLERAMYNIALIALTFAVLGVIVGGVSSFLPHAVKTTISVVVAIAVAIVLIAPWSLLLVFRQNR